MNDFFESLKIFTPTQKDGVIELSVPIVLNVAFDTLTLYIAPSKEVYTIYSPIYFFSKGNDTPKFYFDAFMKHDKSYHYNMRISGDYKVFKQFKSNHNPIFAIDEFVRFFIAFDNFIIDNNVIGNESDFV